MASLYKRKNSPFWWMWFIGPDGKEHWKSTGCRWDNKKETQMAEMGAARLTAQAIERGLKGGVPRDDSWAWVEAFLQRHCVNPKTMKEYRNSWHWWKVWMAENHVHTPGAFQKVHAFDFLEWRMRLTKTSKGLKKKSTSKNTAIKDIKIMSRILDESIGLGYREYNCFKNLRIPKAPQAQKPEPTDEEIATCLEALDLYPEWMRDSFIISLNTGLRLSETRIPVRLIDLKNRTFTVPTPKGGGEMAFTAPIPEVLMPLFEKYKREKREYTVDLPVSTSHYWDRFFKRVGLPHLCFHCLRVRKASELAREGVPIWAAKMLLNHSDDLVHRRYQRLNTEDVRQYANAGTFQASSKPDAAKSQIPSGKHIDRASENPPSLTKTKRKNK